MENDNGRRLIAGTYSEMKTQMILLKQQQLTGGSGFQTADDREFPEWKSKILVKLVFTGKTNSGKYKEVENSLRLIKRDAATFDDARTAELARLVRTKFNQMILELGKNSYSYVNPKQGVRLQQMYLKDVSQARPLVEQILDLNGESPKWELLNLHVSTMAESAYPETPDRCIVAGTSIKTPQRRPLGRVSFAHALIKFPGIPTFKTLCKKTGYELTNLNWLKAYKA